MHCVNCGTHVESDYTFCAKCGAKNVSASDPTIADWRNTTSTPLHTAFLNDPIGYKPSPERHESGAQNRTRMVIFGLASVIAVLIGVLLATKGPSISGSKGNTASDAPASANPEPSMTQITERNVSENYVSEMNSLLAQYSAERTKTSSIVTRYDSGEVIPLAEAEPFFADAGEARKNILQQMNALTPPPSMVNVHVDLTGILQLAISAIDDASAAIRACDGNDCTLNYTNAWINFRSQSKQITKRYNATLKQWKVQANLLG